MMLESAAKALQRDIFVVLVGAGVGGLLFLEHKGAAVTPTSLSDSAFARQLQEQFNSEAVGQVVSQEVEEIESSDSSSPFF